MTYTVLAAFARTKSQKKNPAVICAIHGDGTG